MKPSGKAKPRHQGRVTVVPCPYRSDRIHGVQPCAPLNHKVTRSPEGEVIEDYWTCSCGRRMAR